jgi:histidyl-tRNA synthetase
MIYKHEIPKGSRLYFSKNAKLKRDIENRASCVLEKLGFEEIVVPYFSYYQHQTNIDSNGLIKVSDENNRFINLRADSTIDVTRVATKRLQSSTKNNKWFYIQPVFKFPTDEYYQIGAEDISNNNLVPSIEALMAILKEFDVSCTFQLSSTKLVDAISSNLGVTTKELSNMAIDDILLIDKPWIRDLVYMGDRESAKNSKNMPEEIVKELEHIVSMSSKFEYKNLSISPLYVSNTRYYHGVHFRLFVDNLVIAKGGTYKDDDIVSSGFCIFVDNLIETLVR